MKTSVFLDMDFDGTEMVFKHNKHVTIRFATMKDNVDYIQNGYKANKKKSFVVFEVPKWVPHKVDPLLKLRACDKDATGLQIEENETHLIIRAYKRDTITWIVKELEETGLFEIEERMIKTEDTYFRYYIDPKTTYQWTYDIVGSFVEWMLKTTKRTNRQEKTKNKKAS